MTMQEKLERLKENCNREEYSIIGIYEDEHAYKCYEGYMAPWSYQRHSIYPVAWEKKIGRMGSCLAGTISVIFFGTQFFDDEEFMKNHVMRALEKLEYDPKKIKCVMYKIVN